MVASFAWGVVAQSAYRSRRGMEPIGWAVYLFGDVRDVSPTFALASVAVCAAIVATVVLLHKEILFYCFDAAMAEASGVRAGFIHYLMMLLVSLTIVIGARVVGTVLVTALLVLPGATALALSRRLAGAVTGGRRGSRWPAPSRAWPPADIGRSCRGGRRSCWCCSSYSSPRTESADCGATEGRSAGKSERTVDDPAVALAPDLDRSGAWAVKSTSSWRHRTRRCC